MLPENWDIQSIASGGWIEIERLHFASHVSRAGCVSLPESHTAALRERVWQRLELDPNRVGTRKIFVSRRGAASRHLLNEDEVMEALEPLGFERYNLETLDFAAQVRLFHDASVVVGVYGAGLANILFSPRVRLVEIQTTFPLPHYFFLAQSLGHAYSSVTVPHRQSNNLLVPLDALREALAGVSQSTNAR